MKIIEDQEKELSEKLKEIDYLTKRLEVFKSIIQNKINQSHKLIKDINENKKILKEKGFQSLEEYLVMQEIEEMEKEWT